MVGIPTRGIDLAKKLEKELFNKTSRKVGKGIIDPTFNRDDQIRVGTRLIKATDIPTTIEKQDILLIDDVIYTGRTSCYGCFTFMAKTPKNNVISDGR